MATTAAVLTAKEFGELQLPPDRRFELVAGEVVEMGSGKGKHEYCKAKVIEILVPFALKQQVGMVFAETMYELGPGDTRIPDVSLRLKPEIPTPFPDPYLTAPALAVEIVSSETATELLNRVKDHLRGGSKTIWVVYPEQKDLMVYEADGSTQLLHENDTVTVKWLPGFSARIGEFFEGL